MPELPEVESIRRGLETYCAGKTLAAVTADWPKSFPNEPMRVEAFALGQRIRHFDRRGKLLLMELDNDYVLAVHLKMTGQLVYVGPETEEAVGTLYPNRYTHVCLRLTDGSRIYFNDQRKFGYIKLLSPEEKEALPFLRTIGPEPLTAAFTKAGFYRSLQKKKNSPIKAVLLDQTTVAGIGNIYADESLLLAGLHPLTAAGAVSRAAADRLYCAIRRVLTEALAYGGSSRKDYINAVGQKGDYLDNAFVYGRTGEPCRICGSIIEKTKVAGRGTHICPQCQKLRLRKAGKGANGV
ncbi:MAG: bifunctional DNA-formamidopyrimidine glycosylase/DNA-(apurinic or apyrimidinic site) lyase [Lachnospiraceae bacterium]|nr:bifunctional DNA-formamidopyrimidine glycosylase/DNA-(apurinic or apyrimidinic site) lyase [Lachnospiraceae bacterium]MDY5741613.1 bifunctional DNA-formamidopyrimidine glycosylase/DNA-(apurinic or apyrimidinic site) lyase [Lachnospiraceae bacterium]